MLYQPLLKEVTHASHVFCKWRATFNKAMEDACAERDLAVLLLDVMDLGASSA